MCDGTVTVYQEIQGIDLYIQVAYMVAHASNDSDTRLGRIKACNIVDPLIVESAIDPLR